MKEKTKILLRLLTSIKMKSWMKSKSEKLPKLMPKRHQSFTILTSINILDRLRLNKITLISSW
jgi:hypothetical protein